MGGGRVIRAWQGGERKAGRAGRSKYKAGCGRQGMRGRGEAITRQGETWHGIGDEERERRGRETGYRQWKAW